MIYSLGGKVRVDPLACILLHLYAINSLDVTPADLLVACMVAEPFSIHVVAHVLWRGFSRISVNDFGARNVFLIIELFTSGAQCTHFAIWWAHLNLLPHCSHFTGNRSSHMSACCVRTCRRKENRFAISCSANTHATRHHDGSYIFGRK